jgi:predicted transcriptional regulator
MYRTTEDGRALIRAAYEIHAERHGSQTFTPGTHLPLEAAGRRTGINPERLRYYDAIKDLEYEGTIEWDPSARYARGDKHYVITERGLKMLRQPG